MLHFTTNKPRRVKTMFQKLFSLILVTLLGFILSACDQTGAGPEAATASYTPGAAMDHDMEGTESNSAPFDAQFIDSMIEHHEGAITMAKQALAESERPEIKQLSEGIIAAQQTEIEQMKAWRQAWYPDLAATSGMDMGLGDMQISADGNQPFDQRFITAMISHHQGAIDMAKAAQTKAEHAEIKQLAEAIITAQEAEIKQMQAWNQEWFGQQ
jgi:uncharacterized protein (DUF305 family)